MVGYVGLHAERRVGHALGVPFEPVRDPLALLRLVSEFCADTLYVCGLEGEGGLAYKYVKASHTRHVIVGRRHPVRCHFLAVWA